MEITQKFKCKDADGQLVDKEMKLEFREIDRCRRSDAKLFYAAMGMMSTDAKGEAVFSPASIEKMGTEFIDGLVVKGPDFNETYFVLLKNDVVATFQLNLELFGRVIGPFLTANL